MSVLQELLSKKEFPADVEGSRRLIEEHTQLKKKVGELELLLIWIVVLHINLGLAKINRLELPLRDKGVLDLN